MPYEVTATRKRPQLFGQLAGQEFVAATLEKSLETGRIAHAYLFSGPRGCGKTSTARILAKALNCEKGPTANPCGVCDACRAISAGSSFDVIEIDGASNTSVDNVRQIKDEVLFPPNASRYKIYIIDEVHMLSSSAFNALLKTIEEPPPYVVFMFATTEQHKVPATVKSRCQQFTFRLVPPETVVELLAAAAADIGVSAEPEALLWIARESGGSVRDAYTLFDQVVSFADGRITAALIREKLGLVGQDRMNALFGFFVAGDTAGALSLLETILSGGVSVEQFVADSVEYCRSLLLIKNGISRESLLGAPLSSFDLSIAEALSAERVEKVFSIFLGAYRNLKESIDPRYELDLAVARASHIGSYVPPSELVRAVGALKRYVEQRATGSAAGYGAAGSTVAGSGFAGAGASPARAGAAAPQAAGRAPRPAEERYATERPAPKPEEPKATASAQSAPALETRVASSAASGLSDLAELKRALVADIRKNNVLLATTLDKSRAWRIKGDTLSLTVATPMECDLLRRFLGIIAEVLAQRAGESRKIEVLLASPESEAENPDAAASSFAAGPGLNGAPENGLDAQSAPGGPAPGGPASADGRTAPQAAPEAAPEAAQPSRAPLAFNEGAQAESPAAAEPVAAKPSPPRPRAEEKAAIGAVERLFKGKLERYVQPQTVQGGGGAHSSGGAQGIQGFQSPRGFQGAPGGRNAESAGAQGEDPVAAAREAFGDREGDSYDTEST